MQSTLPNLLGPKEVKPDNLHGRTAIVTGGTQGIGYEVSRALAHAGCKVIMVSRKADQGAECIAQIRKESPDADVDWQGCDLGKLSDVKSRFSKLRESLDRLDFLVLSGGVNANQFSLDDDGIDRHMGVNYLGHYYAVNQLWPLLRKTASLPGATAPRIVAESSELHRMAASDVKFESLEELNDENYDPTRLYARSKLALILFVKYGLVERVIKPNSDNIYALAVHPGAVATKMQDQWKKAYPGITGTILTWVNTAFSRDPEQGSYSTLWALTAPEITEKGQNGFYFSDPETLGKETAQASDPKLGENLWKLSEKIVKDKLGNDALIDWNAK